tara:strand:+ start:2365 stop:2754 length:390 start_codon:yes stop_codon:yes gene_type:complete
MFSDRINIQYSLDVEELPTEVCRLISKIEEQAAELVTSIKAHPQDKRTVLSPHTLEEIDLFRRRLAAMDYALSDVNNIISSYLEYKTQASSDTATNTQSEVTKDVVISQDDLFRDLSVLQDQVNSLQEK